MQLDPIIKLSKDLKTASVMLSKTEARYLVDSYYQMQANRIRSNEQIRSLSTNNEPHQVLEWLSENSRLLENNIKRALDAYSDGFEVGLWSKSIVGIGPVIAAGLLAHIDMDKAPTAGHIFSFAGLVSGVEWKKGQKRPWNADLKSLCWKIGESFVKFSGHKNDFYGKLYLERKAIEKERNDQGLFENQAKTQLEKFNFGKSTDAYKHYIKGKLPPAHIHARARRWVVLLFLSHWHEVAYKEHYGREAPEPYAIGILKHGHRINPPNI